MLSSAEINTWEILEELGFVVKKNADRNENDASNTIYSQYGSCNLPKIRLDFALLSANIAIEVQGDYWHATDKSQKKLTTTQVESRLQDSYKHQLLITNGWQLITIHEKDVMTNRPRSKTHLESSILSLMLV